MHLRTLIYLFLGLSILNACKKETNSTSGDPNGSNLSKIPAITSVTILKKNIQQYKDSINFFINYSDGDGDIGYYQADSNSLYITDTRNNITESFFVKPQAPKNSTIAIKGTLSAKLPFTILVDTTKTQETTNYIIQLKDRAGNYSNKFSTDNITIIK